MVLELEQQELISVRGSVEEIQIIDTGFDYTNVPTVKLTGGNGSGAVLSAQLAKIVHKVDFNSNEHPSCKMLPITQLDLQPSTSLEIMRELFIKRIMVLQSSVFQLIPLIMLELKMHTQ